LASICCWLSEQSIRTNGAERNNGPEHWDGWTACNVVQQNGLHCASSTHLAVTRKGLSVDLLNHLMCVFAASLAWRQLSLALTPRFCVVSMYSCETYYNPSPIVLLTLVSLSWILASTEQTGER
jgi:hypothetical protein